MRALLALLAVLIPALIPSTAVAAEASTNVAKKVYILPIRDDIMPPLVYLVRRGVKEAMEAKADLLVLDMETNGGRVDTTREIISILNEFKGDTVTFVNKDAFSAGAFIAVATKRIYMAPESVIGAAAPIIMSPGGDGVEKMPDTYEKKMTSAVKAMVRTTAEKNGHNIAVVEAMIDKTRGLVLTNVTAEATNAVVIAKEGDILTLTNTEAEKEYGNPPKRLLSSGTVKDLDTLIAQLGYAGATTHRVDPTGMEKIGSWLNVISPLLLIIGIAGIYIEFKTPGFGLPGIVGITAFALYFLGGYVAGLSGAEWVVVFVLGLALIIVELFVYPGTIIIGMLGATLMLAALIMAMVDLYPATTRAFCRRCRASTNSNCRCKTSASQRWAADWRFGSRACYCRRRRCIARWSRTPQPACRPKRCSRRSRNLFRDKSASPPPPFVPAARRSSATRLSTSFHRARCCRKARGCGSSAAAERRRL
ncbi:MAG: ATP-dependent Clp protease proteolytic subunit [Verrucomicrobia bacterium]|nr:ATP-dependent Clp protease proteolytic subunit [Verrucomicrobiota bacterium]